MVACAAFIPAPSSVSGHALLSEHLLRVPSISSWSQGDSKGRLHMASGTQDRQDHVQSSPTRTERAAAFPISRRALIPLLLPLLSITDPGPAHSVGLAERMRTRKADDLSKPILPSFVAIPTQEQVYPEWLAGEWEADGQFAGFELPVKEISKKQLMADAEVPGFQKLSVLTLPDMAAPLKHSMRFVKGPDGKVRQDREYNLVAVVNSGLGYQAVESVKCQGERCTVNFVRGKTRNAERVEVLYVARESEEPKGGAPGLFVSSEFVRQVTLGLSKQFGVAREVIGEYQTFGTWVPGPTADGASPTKARLNLLTAAYLQPQDNLFFQAATKPVVVYANDFILTRK